MLKRRARIIVLGCEDMHPHATGVEIERLTKIHFIDLSLRAWEKAEIVMFVDHDEEVTILKNEFIKKDRPLVGWGKYKK